MNGRLIRQIEGNKPTIPVIGKIKVGIKNENGLPKSVDHFVATGRYLSHFEKAYGNKPQKVHVVFMEDDPAKVCNLRYELRDNQGKLVASGDGENFKVWNPKANNGRGGYDLFTETEHPEIMNKISKKTNTPSGWQTVLTLRFLLPMVNTVWGYWEFSTKGSASSIPNIIGIFDAIIENQGFVRGMVFDLTVDFAKSQKPNDRSRYPVVNLVLNHDQSNLDQIKKGALIDTSGNTLIETSENEV